MGKQNKTKQNKTGREELVTCICITLHKQICTLDWASPALTMLLIATPVPSFYAQKDLQLQGTHHTTCINKMGKKTALNLPPTTISKTRKPILSTNIKY